MNRRLITLLLAMTAFCGRSLASTADYTFRIVADSTGGTFGAFDPPTINSNGDVVLGGQSSISSAPRSGVYFWHASTLSPVFEVGAREQYQNIRMNDAGSVTFLRSTSQLYVGSATAGVTKIVDTASGTFSQLWNFLDTSPLIDETSRVVFEARLPDGTFGIYDGPSPVANKIADSHDPTGFPNLMSIDRGGTIYFRGLVGQSAAIYTGPTLAQKFFDFGTTFNNPADFQVNSHGKLVFNAFIPVGSVFPQGLFTGPNPTTDKFVDTNGPLNNINGVDLNDAGEIAFYSSLDDGRTGIFTGPDVVLDKVIASGDPLFGSTVQSIQFFKGLSDNGDIAFAYVLANNVGGIAVATVPEPSTTLALACFGPMALASRRAIKRRRYPEYGACSGGHREITRGRKLAHIERRIMLHGARAQMRDRRCAL